MMKIKGIEITNFKIYKYENIDFKGNQLILLTGPNGYGKTSLIDAIEWCITGNVTRAHENFDSRYTTKKEKERVENKRGVLKNKDCKSTDKIKVKLTLLCDDQEIVITREREEDTLERREDFTIEGDILSKEIRERIEKLRREKSLYKYNFCDMNKAYRFMNSSRTDIKNQVKEFLSDRSEVENLIEKLSQKVKDTEEKSERNNEKIENQTQLIKNKIAEKSKIVILHDIDEYSKFKVYEGEPTLIESSIQAKAIIDLVRGWGYNFVHPIVINLKKSKESIAKKEKLLKIKSEYEKEKELIDKFVKFGLNNQEKRDEISNQIIKLTEKNKLLEKKFNADAAEYESYLVIKKRFERDKNKYNSFINEVGLLDKNIQSLGRAGKLAEVFTKLVEGKNVIISEYQKKEKKKCPLCGSTEKFPNLNENNIAEEARIYLEEQDKIQKDNIEKKEEKKNEADLILKEFIDFSDEWFKLKIDRLREKNKKQAEEWNKIEKFFDLIHESKISLCEDMHGKINTEIDNADKGIVTKLDETQMKDNIYKVLGFLKYPKLEEIKSENYIASVDLIDSLYRKDIVYNDFNHKEMVNKLTYLESYLASAEMNKIDHEIGVAEKQLKVFKDREKAYEEQINKLKGFIKDIGEKIKKLEQLEFEEVGPYLYKIFSKIIKHTNVAEFKFNRDNSNSSLSGSGFLDADKNNIMNMFSEGQLGVFIISYFIGNILKRKNENVLESFFMDDITNCLDDINVLSFIDIMKYLLKDTSNGMNQLFFATCNDNIEALFRNRMDGFGIPYKLIEFASVGNVKKVKDI